MLQCLGLKLYLEMSFIIIVYNSKNNTHEDKKIDD